MIRSFDVLSMMFYEANEHKFLRPIFRYGYCIHVDIVRDETETSSPK